MASTFSGSLAITLRIQELLASGAFGAPGQHVLDAFAGISLDNGTTSGKIDIGYSALGAPAASSADSYDLAGTLKDRSNTTFTMAKLKIVALHNTGTTSIRLKSPSNGVPLLSGSTDGLDLAPGAVFIYYDPAGVTVTASTGDLLSVTNLSGSTAAAYRIILAGSTS
jgi:hypothetical protein